MASAPPVKVQTNETLRNDIWRACDIMRRDNNVGGILAYTEHLAWLLFLKFLDEEEKKRTIEAELVGGESYTPVIPEDLAWDRWAGEEALEKWKADELIQFVRGRLLPRLATLSGSHLAITIARIFSDESTGDQNVVRNVPVCASGHNLKDVLSIVNKIQFGSEDDIYTISKVYEDLLEKMGNENRSAGEFYTPRAVIRFMVEVIDPKIGETVYDPATGSAGFLAEAYLWMHRSASTTQDDETLQHHTFYGQEKKALSALLGTMNMVLHGVATPNILRENTLEESMIGSVSNRHDIILTNPPFGGQEGQHIQKNFPVRANATELLFLQHIAKKLKREPTGRAAIVVPEGTLFRGGAFATVKKELLEDFHLFAVISLPTGTFAPYSDVKTALVFLQRPDEVLKRNPAARHETWYYELPLPEGAKKFSKGTPIADEHFTEARAMWKQWRAWLDGEGPRPFPLASEARADWKAHYDEGAERPAWPTTAWVETGETLRERSFDLSSRNPHQNERVILVNPLELTAQLMESTRELHNMLENLHEMLSNRNGSTDG